jgi:hypothetical protein
MKWPKTHYIQDELARQRCRFNGTYCGHPGKTSDDWEKVTCLRCLRYRAFAQGKLKLVYQEVP